MINNYKTIKKQLSKIAKTLSILGIATFSLTANAQYCTSTANNAYDNIGAFSFGSFSNVQSASPAVNNPASINLYTNYTALGPIQAQQGGYYPINITQINQYGFSNCTATIYIDFDHSGTFDVGEDVYSGSTNSSAGGNVLSASVHIPVGVALGTTRLRVVLIENSSPTPCGSYSYGETEDYKIKIVAGSACMPTPIAGTINIADTAVCAGTQLSLSLMGNSQGIGTTFEWETSADGTTSWASTGDTLPSITTYGPSDSIFHRVKVSCNGGVPSYTTVTKIKAAPNYACYCSSNLGTNCNSSILNVSLSNTTLNNTTSCTNGYTSYYPSTIGTTANLMQASTYNLTLNISSASSAGVWIDFDQSGTFDGTEYFPVTLTPTSGVATISVPTNAPLGKTGMRVRLATYSFISINSYSACSNFYAGETEDYVITIAAGVACVGTPTAGTLSSNSTALCPSETTTITLAGQTQGVNIHTVWESSADGVTGWTATGDSSVSLLTFAPSDSAFYRIAVDCNGGAPVYTNVIKLTVAPSYFCYCTSNLGGSCGLGDIKSFSITSTTLSNLNSGCGTNFGIDNYNKYPASGATTATLTQASTYTFNGTFEPSVQQAGVWIDYDQSGTFDGNEYYQWSAPSANSTGLIITIPANALVGKTGLRVRSRATNFNNSCQTFGSGETEDYVITIGAGVPCAGTPTAGILSATDLTPCPSTYDTLTLTGATSAIGIAYEWQTSVDNTNWTATGDSTTQSFDFGITAGDSIYYRVKVTCNNGAPVYTNVVKLKANPNFYQCYCATASSYADDNIGKFAFGTFNNTQSITPSVNNTNSTALYTDYTTLGPIVAQQALSYPINITQISKFNFSNACNVKIFIDYDHSGTYDFGEDVYSASTLTGSNTNVLTGNVTIPTSALIGTTGLRVVLSYGTWSTVQSCGNYYAGETEDYVINITPGVPCAGVPTAGTINTTDTAICAGTQLNLTASGYTQAVGILTEWETSADGVTGWSATGDTTATISTYGPSDSIYYRVKVTCSGGAPVYTLVTKVKASPTYACYCSSNLGVDCSTPITNVTIVGTTLNNTSTCAGGYSSYYPATSTTTANLMQAVSYTLNVAANASFGTAIVGVWIDYDQSGSFDGTEYTPIISGTATITTPANALLGKTGMRVRTTPYTFVTMNGSSACSNLYAGETEDYVINIVAGTPCAGTPTAGTLTASTTAMCPSDITTITLAGNTQALNIHTVWETSIDGITWTATGDSSITLQEYAPSDSAYYRVAVDCNGGAPVYTNVVKLTLAPANLCYCTSSLGGQCGYAHIEGVEITNTTLSNLVNGCGNNGGINNYNKYPATGATTASLTQTANYTIQGVFEQNVQQAAVWIDYDQSGTFDANEMTIWNTPSATLSAATFTIPVTALPGVTGMRVRSRASSFGTIDPCNYNYDGETEDYQVTIVAAAPCAGTPTAGTVTATAGLLCANTEALLSINGTTVGLGINKDWEESSDGINWTSTGYGTSTYSVVAPADSIFYRVAVNCNAGTTVYTNVIKIALNTNFLDCYCSANLHGNAGYPSIDTTVIVNTTFVNNAGGMTSNTSVGYSKFATTATLFIDSTYTIDVKMIANANISMWIDYNRNGLFDATEWTQIAANTVSGSNLASFTIPATAMIGKTGMRVRTNLYGTNDSTSACSNFYYGETEDYVVKIDTAATVPPVAIAKQLAGVSFVAYPNPTMDIVTIAIQGNTTAAVKCEVLNNLGQVVYTNTTKQLNGVEKLKVDLSNYASGSYTIRVVSNNNVTVKRVMLQR